MLLHARGLDELGVQSTLAFSDSCLNTGIAGIDARVPGARLLAGSIRSIRREQPDVINVHSLCAPAFIVARQAGLIHGRVVVMSYAADERALSLFPESGTPQLLRFLRTHLPARATMRFAHGIWCVSRIDAKYYSERYSVDPIKAKYIPHAVDPTFFDALDVRRERAQIAFVGTWIYRKGNDVLIKAMKEVARARPDVILVIAGTFAGEAEVRAAMRGVPAGNLRVIPQLDDEALRVLYRESSLLLVPSRLEGMPFSMLEAMACGCPSLAAANSGMLDAIAEDENGWLMDTFDPHAWATQIIELLSTPERLRTASNGARKNAEKFRLRTLSETALTWYESLAD